MDKIVTVEIRNVYGTDKVYPAGPTARLFCELTGTRTLTEAHLTTIRELGYRVIFS